MSNLIVALTVATFASATSLANAADDKFEVADVDNNGELTFEEGVSVHSDWTEEAFAKLDTDGNGALSKQEYDAAMMKTDG